MQAPDLKTLERSMTLLTLVKYVKVASVAILIYDYLLTFKAEVKYVWRSKWGLGKILFLLARYSAIAAAPMVLYYLFGVHIPVKSCHRLYSAGTWLLLTVISWAEAILIMRTYALSGNNWRVLVFLFGIQFSVFGPGAWVVNTFLHSVQYGDPPYPSITGCYTVTQSSVLRYGFTAVVGEELIIMLFTLWFGLTRFRYSRNHIVSILYRDGISYFILLAGISLGNILVQFFGPPELLDLLVTFQPMMHSVLSCRIVLQVRSVANMNQMTADYTQGSTLEFHHPPTTYRDGSLWQRTIKSLTTPQTWTIDSPDPEYELASHATQTRAMPSID